MRRTQERGGKGESSAVPSLKDGGVISFSDAVVQSLTPVLSDLPGPD